MLVECVLLILQEVIEAELGTSKINAGFAVCCEVLFAFSLLEKRLKQNLSEAEKLCALLCWFVFCLSPR